jgi:hypothetical protein
LSCNLTKNNSYDLIAQLVWIETPLTASLAELKQGIIAGAIDDSD